MLTACVGQPTRERPLPPTPIVSAQAPAPVVKGPAVVAAPVVSGDQPVELRVTWEAGRGDERSRLAVGWILASEVGPQGPSLKGVLSWFEHATVYDVDAYGEGATVRVSLPKEPVHLFTVLDRRGRLLATLMGSTIEGNQLATVGPIVAADTKQTDIAMKGAPPRPERPEACAGDRFELVRIDDPERGLPSARRLCVYLPKSYAIDKKKRYPVIYLLPGFSSTDTTYLRGDQAPARFADEVGATLGRDVILVGVDTSTSFGSTYFTDSPAQGAWETFATTAMIEAIDARFRTMQRPEGRALAGHSTGGFNAVSLAMRHPETFGWVASSSPDALDMDGWLWRDGIMTPTWLGFMRVEDATGGQGQMRSYAAAWSDLMWPADLHTGKPREPARGQWNEASPIRWLTGDGLARAKKLSGRMIITCGRADEADLFGPTERFVKAAAAAKVDVTWLPTELGHFADARARWTPLFDFLLKGLPRAAP